MIIEQLGVSYDALGFKLTTTYPDPVVGTVNHYPNSFGQPRQASGTGSSGTTNYADLATYYPSGSINSFNFGNGVIHKTTLNSRKLPAQLREYKGAVDNINLSYTYDLQNNIISITDAVNPEFSTSSLTYDGLDRLISTTGGTGIGNTGPTTVTTTLVTVMMPKATS